MDATIHTMTYTTGRIQQDASSLTVAQTVILPF